MKDNNLITMIKGMIVGGTMMVPGVSGGSMAMILGIYERLVTSVSSFRKDKRACFLFLALFSIGGGAGMIIFANPLLHLIESYPKPMLYFFLGAVAGGIPLIYKQAEVTQFSWKVPMYICVGLIIVLLFSALPTGASQSEMGAGVISFLLLVFAGFIAAVALVLPGISVSYLLLLMGLYDETMRAIGEFYLPFLVPLGIGLLLGIVMTTKILERAMKKYPQPTYLIILGFVLGSVVEVFPGLPGGREFILCFVMSVVGYGIIRMISRKEMNGIRWKEKIYEKTETA